MWNCVAYIGDSKKHKISHEMPKLIYPTNLSPASSTIFTVSLPNTGTLVWMNRKRKPEHWTGCKNQLILLNIRMTQVVVCNSNFVQTCFARQNTFCSFPPALCCTQDEAGHPICIAFTKVNYIHSKLTPQNHSIFQSFIWTCNQNGLPYFYEYASTMNLQS